MLKKFNTLTLFFSNKMVVIRAGIKKMLVRIANREEPDLTVSSDLGLPCLPRPFLQGN